MEMVNRTNTGFKVSFIQPVREVRSELEDKMLFIKNSLIEEVGTNPKKARSLHKLFKRLAIGVGVKLMLPATALAATHKAATVTASASQITPQHVLHWGLILALVVVSIGVALSMSMLAIAGIYRMFKREKEATEWSNDIVRGLVQVLIAIPVVYIFFLLAQMVFTNLPALNGLFSL